MNVFPDKSIRAIGSSIINQVIPHVEVLVMRQNQSLMNRLISTYPQMLVNPIDLV